jgi:hypothetical protein
MSGFRIKASDWLDKHQLLLPDDLHEGIDQASQFMQEQSKRDVASKRKIRSKTE